MESDNSKKLPTDLVPSPKRLKMDESGATLHPELGLTEEMEGQQTLEETSAQTVLRLPELLSMIFGHLADDSDLKSLKNARLVCSLWKHEVFFALKSNLSLVPAIIHESPNSEDLSDSLEDMCRNKSLESSANSLMPGCDFPLKLAVNQWTPQLESFLRDFSTEIVCFGICGSDIFHGFPTDLGSIELPALRHADFCASGIGSDEGKLREFVKAMTFWNTLVKASRKLLTRECIVDISDMERIRLSNGGLDQVEWSQVGDLRCSYEFFAEICASNELSALHHLECYSYQGDDNGSENEEAQVPRISLKKAPNLSYLVLCNQAEWILDHPMRKLTFLMLEGTTISGSESPSKLLPNLEDIIIDEVSTEEARPFDCLTSGGGMFEKAVDLILSERWMNLNERIGEVAERLSDSFPKLTSLEWQSGNDEIEDLGGDDDNNNALYAAPVIFSRLEFLTTLDLGAVLPSEREVVELVTGISLENIPEDENSWPTALVDNPRSITNLKNLGMFSLKIQAEPITIDSRHTRFLFAAAFRTMQTLEELYFEYIDFEDTSCATEWEQMGRHITLSFEDEHQE